MRFRKIYIEISNICNLKCSFCPGTKRQPKAMTAEEFQCILPKLRPYTDFIYFHIMGEPLCHPDLSHFLALAGSFGFKVIITTNGTLVGNKGQILLDSPVLHKINISLHAFEANDLAVPFEKYLDDCFSFGTKCQGKKLLVYRLWNSGGKEALNNQIITKMKEYFPAPWIEQRNGQKLSEKVFLEYGDKFDWPDLSAEDGGERVFCYGLRDQIGILCDGTVVPCCLDHEGDIPLGNIFTDNMDDILASPKALAIYNGFTNKTAVEPLCRKCGYARRFK